MSSSSTTKASAKDMLHSLIREQCNDKTKRAKCILIPKDIPDKVVFDAFGALNAAGYAVTYEYTNMDDPKLRKLHRVGFEEMLYE